MPKWLCQAALAVRVTVQLGVAMLLSEDVCGRPWEATLVSNFGAFLSYRYRVLHMGARFPSSVTTRPTVG